MFEFWRNWRKTDAEKRQEAVNAYLDDALPADERQAFEKEMARDEALRQEVESLRVLRAQLSQLPSRPVPRNFMLDPAKYGRPASQPLFQFYPALRAATVLTGLFLIVALAGGILNFTGGSAQMEMASDTAATSEMAQEEAAPLAAEPEMDTAVENFGAGAEGGAADMADDVSEEVVEEEIVAEEEAEEPMAESAAEEPPPAQPDADGAMAEAEEEAADEEAADAPAGAPAAEDDAGLPEPTPSPLPTIELTPLPTATAPPAIARDVQPVPAPTAAPVPETAVSTPTIDPLPIIILVLLVAFVVLLTITLWVRRRL